jgi:hypothetical protein
VVCRNIPLQNAMHSVLALENRSMKKELENATDALMSDVGH